MTDAAGVARAARDPAGGEGPVQLQAGDRDDHRDHRERAVGDRGRGAQLAPAEPDHRCTRSAASRRGAGLLAVLRM